MTDASPMVVVFGEALVDVIDGRRIPGGAPLNVATHLRGFGSAPLLLTRVGIDDDGALLIGRIRAAALALAGVQRDPQRATGRVDVTIDACGLPSYAILDDAAWDHIDDTQVLAALGTVHGARPWLYHGSLALRSQASANAWRAACRHLQGPRFVDLNWRAGAAAQDTLLAAVRGAAVVKTSRDELHRLAEATGCRSRFAAALPARGERCAAIAAMCRMLAIGRLLVTDGVLGSVAIDDDGTVSQAQSCAPVPTPGLADTVGAGDAFSATVLHGLVTGWPLAVAMRRAAGFAARICACTGAVPEDPAAYVEQRRSWEASDDAWR
jgi:fructokinase